MDAVLFLYFIAALSLTTIQGLNVDIAAEIIPGDPDATTCPSTSNARQRLTNLVHDLVSGRILNIGRCGGGLWRRIVSVNMSKPDNQCPPSWVEENEGGVRACGRGTVGGSCVSATFSTGGLSYSKVCGRAIGYQYGNTDAFAERSPGVTLEENYVDGLSITYGRQPRQHIWTYASGLSEISDFQIYTCPCLSNSGQPAPAYLGNNWYCESGNPEPRDLTPDVFSDDPLWDGQDCEGNCCLLGRSPPWFSVELSGTTSEDIEARVCANEHSDNREDIFIAVFEVYIQ